MTDPSRNSDSNTDSTPDSTAGSDPTSLRQVWSRNGRCIFGVLAVTASVLTGCALVRGIDRPDAIQSLALVQLWITALVVPVAVRGARFTVDIFYRGASTNDSFGAFLIAVSVIGGGWGILTALKLYVLLSSVGLLLVVFFLWLRRLDPGSPRPSLAVAALGIAIAALHTFVPAETWSLSPAASRLSVLLAAADTAAVQRGSTSWLITSLIYVAGAGLCWSLYLVAGVPSGPADRER